MKSSEHITREQLDKVVDILELGRIKYSGTNATMRCPLCRNKNHTFIVDMSSGKYRCNHCSDIGSVEYLGITICANNVYYRLIDYYTDQQLNALIELFD